MWLIYLISWPIFSRQFPNIRRSLETGSRVLAFLDQPLEADGASELKIEKAQVVFDDVQFAYEEGKPVLRDIAFQASPGQTIALVGHTGSGKSSIMNLLYRFYDPQEGAILIDGQDIRQVSRESLRSHMGIVLQDPYLFTGTIASNVAMSQDHIDRNAVKDALKKVGAWPFVERLEKGIDHPVVEKGSAFSSGERQLISFARTLYMNPQILILDEATSHIDTETEEIIQKAMAVLQKGRTTFIIAHAYRPFKMRIRSWFYQKDALSNGANMQTWLPMVAFMPRCKLSNRRLNKRAFFK